NKSKEIVLADAEAPILYLDGEWKIKETIVRKNRQVSITNNSILTTSLIEISDAEKINIEISAIIRGKPQAFISLFVKEYDSEKNEIKREKPIYFRFSKTRVIKGNESTRKRFSFQQSEGCKYLSLNLTASNFTKLFICKYLSIYKVGNHRFVPVDLTAKFDNEDKIELVGEKNALLYNFKFIKRNSYIQCDGNIETTDNKEFSAIIRFALPIESKNLYWYDSFSKKRKIVNNEIYSNWHKLGKERFFSIYPFSLIETGQMGIAFALPPDRPRIFRTGYSNEDGYFIEFDCGISPETKKFPSQYNFRFLIFGQKSKWGLRKTAEKFYKIFPSAFEKYKTKEGIWFAWLEPKKILFPQDFGFMFDITIGKTLFFDRYYGIIPFFYQEPYGIGIQWSKKGSPNRIPEDVSYEDIVKKIKSPKFTKGKSFDTAHGKKNYAVAAIESAMEDENGQYYIGRYRPYLYTNPDPELPYGKLVVERVSFRQERSKNKKFIAGQYIDSVVPARLAIKEDYKKSHFQYADIPLCFSYETGKPIELGLFPSIELATKISQITKVEGGLTLANLWSPMHTFYYNIIDILGAGEYSSDQPIENFHYLRAISPQKTLSFIDRNLIEGRLTEKDISRCFMKCLAFAVYPGALPFKEPEKYEKLRPFYKKYIPLIRLLSSSGWRPIPYANASNSSLNIERFGNSNRNIYFTIFNPTNKEITFTFEVEKELFKRLETKELHYYDLTRKKIGSFSEKDSKFITNLTISAEETILIQIGKKENFLSTMFFLLSDSISGLEKFYIHKSKAKNLIKNISKQKDIEFEFDGKSPSISGVVISNREASKTSVFRLSVPIEKANTDYRIGTDRRNTDVFDASLFEITTL
ncbi:MAG: hypothetical protein D6734_13330, partial [Candidatus Schekmanbacteria bacterium]